MADMASLNLPRVQAILDRYFLNPETVKLVEYNSATDSFTVHTWTTRQGKLMYGEGCNYCATPDSGCPVHRDGDG